MNKNTLKKWSEDPWRIAISLARRSWLNFLPDKTYLSILYRASFGKRLNWKEPKTFNEKLQWLKVYDRNPVYSTMVDKYEAKQYVAERIGEEHIVPVVGGPWDRFEEIDFDALPNQFVLKTTHDCGGVFICQNKAELNKQSARDFLEKHLGRDYYLHNREWPYKEVKPRIFAEEYLSDIKTGEVRDYKFFCFDGVPKLMFIASERQSEDQETKFDFYDMDFTHLPIINGHPNSSQEIACPANFERMKELAAVLSKGIPHLRVDFFECNERLYLGELTFSHWGGFVPFEPEEWDDILGSWIHLQKEKGGVMIANSKTIQKYLENPWRVAVSMARRGWLDGLSDKAFLSLMYRARFGQKLQWEPPVTFSEKLQWLKLNDRKPIYSKMADKYESKQYVRERIGGEYVIPVIGGPWNHPDEINFDALPDQFVLKTTHDCGGVLICRDKSTFDIPAAKDFLQKHLQREYYLHCREWPYKDIKPRIYAEKYLSEFGTSAAVRDYKFFTFNGEPKLMYIASGRDYAKKDKQVVYADFFDMEFNHVGLCIDHDNAPEPPSKPRNFEMMVECARKLAQGTKHLRVDFYEVNGQLYSGELTFFHCGGLHPFKTKEWDRIMGEWILLD